MSPGRTGADIAVQDGPECAVDMADMGLVEHRGFGLIGCVHAYVHHRLTAIDLNARGARWKRKGCETDAPQVERRRSGDQAATRRRRGASSPGSHDAPGADGDRRAPPPSEGSWVQTQESRPVCASGTQVQMSRRRLGGRRRAVCGAVAFSGTSRAVGRLTRLGNTLKASIKRANAVNIAHLRSSLGSTAGGERQTGA